MTSTMLRATAQTPSSFSMPACGHASARTLLSAFAERPWVKSAQTQAQVRTIATDLNVIAARGGKGLGFTGDLATAPTYVPGTTAWSPPSC